MATLKDIAKQTGLTISTVSDILNKREGSRYAEASRQKVFAAAEELGYDRNRLVQSMIKGRSNLIGVLVPDLNNPFYNTILQTVSPHLRKAGYSILIEEALPEATPASEARALQEFSEFRVDGIIACLIHAGAHEAVFKKFAKRQLPVVGIGMPITAHSAYTDSYGIQMENGIREACQYLVAAGRTRFAFLGNFPWDEKLGRRWTLLQSNLQELGMEGQPSVNINCKHNRRGALAAFTDYLQRTPPERRPDALFTLNDNLAIGACRAAKDMGLRVPEDLAVVGFDNTALGAIQSPSISTIGVDLEDLGQTIANRLLERLETKEVHCQEFNYSTRFIPRETC